MIKIHNTSFKNQANLDNSKNSPQIDGNTYKEFINKLHNSEIVIYEKDINSSNEDSIDVYVYPITEIKKENERILSYPLFMSINKTYSLSDLESLINERIKTIINDQYLSKGNTIEICYPHFEDKWGEFKINEGKCPICGKIYEKKQNYCSLFPTIDKGLKINI